jgi:peptidyl-prolyl cis-trans isomerase C
MLSVAVLACAVVPGLAWAQLEPRMTMPIPTRERAVREAIANPAPARANPVVASVDGYPIHLDDLGQAMQTLPEHLRGMPFETLYPVLVDRLVDHQSLVIMAKRAGLEESPHVQREIRRATERILEATYLERETKGKASDEVIRDTYQRGYANRPAVDEVRARHILLGSEAEARKVIADLRDGADFVTLARTLSKDPTGANGGDLGFFRRDQVWPAFGDLAFALLPGQIGNNPIRNEFGWHVVRVEERRQVAAPSLSELEPMLRRELLTQAVREAIERARGQVIIRRFNLDGSDLETGPRFSHGVAPEQTSQEAPQPTVPSGR